MVHLVGLDLLEQVGEAEWFIEVAVVELELLAVVSVVEVVDASAVQLAGAPHEPVHLVALSEEKLGQVRAVLAGDPGDESDAGHRRPPEGLESEVDRRAVRTAM